MVVLMTAVLIVVLTTWNLLYFDYLYRERTRFVSLSIRNGFYAFSQSFPSQHQVPFHHDLFKRDESPTAVPINGNINVIENKAKSRGDEVMKAASPFYLDYRSMVEDDHRAMNERQFPPEGVCQYLGLRRPITKETTPGPQTAPACRPILRTKQDCAKARVYFGTPGTIVPQKCNGTIYAPICSVKLSRKNGDVPIKVHCNKKLCKKGSVSIGFLNEDTGLTEAKDWVPVKSIHHLQLYLLQHMRKSVFAKCYALLRCKSLVTGEQINQTVFLPILTKRKQKPASKKQINVNIIMEDSASRRHFYRSLPRTTTTMKEIIHNAKIKATVLDFELVQSMSDSTVDNTRNLFASGNFDKQTYGHEVLYGTFKKAGYRTLLQDNACWSGPSGTMLHMDHVVSSTSDRKAMLEKWQRYKQFVEKRFRNIVDDYGLTFRTCSVFNELDIFHMFNYSTVCYNGELLEKPFFDYLKHYTRSLHGGQPFLAYAHLLTAHDKNGQRLASADRYISEFVKHAAGQQDTLSIILAGHGEKLSPYAIHTKPGRYEVYRPFLFIIVPNNVAKRLRKDAMDALVVNQKRLVTLQDLHHALTSLATSTPARNKGLFAPIPLTRTCADVVNRRPEVLCRCQLVGNNSYTTK